VHEFGTWNWVAYTETLPDGSYSLWLPSGTYGVRVFGVEGWQEQYYLSAGSREQATPVVVTVPNETSGIDFVLARLAAIVSGHVYQADGGTPISGAGVAAFDEAIGKWVGTVTGDDGSYSLRLASGSYKIWANADAWVGEFYDNANRIEDATVVTVVAPEERSGIDFALTEARARIKGHVYQDDGTTPIIGARIAAHVYSTGEYMGFTYAGDDGSYTLPVPPGTFRVSAQAPRWHLQHYAAPVTVADSQVVENINFNLESTPFALSGLQWGGQRPGRVGLKWLPRSGMLYSVYWTEQLKNSQTVWHEVPDAPNDFQQNDGYLVWSDNGTSPGMSELAPGDPAVRQRYYRVLEEAQ
jgi:hypothetical protein